MPSAFPTDGSTLAYIPKHVTTSTEVHADDANSWSDLHGHSAVERISTSLPTAWTALVPNGAESFFSRLHRAEAGHHHNIAGAYLARYAQEGMWPEVHHLNDNACRFAAWSAWC